MWPPAVSDAGFGSDCRVAFFAGANATSFFQEQYAETSQSERATNRRAAHTGADYDHIPMSGGSGCRVRHRSKLRHKQYDSLLERLPIEETVINLSRRCPPG